MASKNVQFHVGISTAAAALPHSSWDKSASRAVKGSPRSILTGSDPWLHLKRVSEAKKDLYDVLGVSRDVSPAELREAFQGLALRHHPDRDGGETGAFQEIAAAYKVLSEPAARARYDEESRTPRAATPVRCGAVEPLVPPEPLLGRRRRPARRPTLVVDPGTALWGGRVIVVLPLDRVCPRCGGLAPDPFCACRGRGRIHAELPLDLHLPPLIRDGAVVPLEIPGLGVVELEIRVR